MSDASTGPGVDRRAFLKGAVVAGSGVAASAGLSAAESQIAQAPPASSPAAAPKLASETFITTPGSDFMVDVLKAIGLEYMASNPAAAFRSLHESIVNYGENTKPEFLTCLHEESAAAMAHGYAKASGKPMGIVVHGTVGLQHASMGIYNAWCDRVPMVVFTGNTFDVTHRRPGVEWIHSAIDPAAIVRDFTKWDDKPVSLQHFAESTVRGWRYSQTCPMGPVVIDCDLGIQEEPIPNRKELKIPTLVRPAQPQGDTAALREAARWLVAAEKPLIIADRATRSQRGVERMVELAEALGAPVVDLGGRMNFPTTHDLELNFMRATLVREADVILLLEVNDVWGTLHSQADPYKTVTRLARPDVKLITVSMQDVFFKANYQDFQRFMPVELAIGGDVEASLPDLVEAVRTATPAARRSVVAQRAQAYAKLHREMKQRDREASALGWDASPVSTARLGAEMWQTIKNEKWSLVVSDRVSWARRLWPATEHHQFLGGPGGYGVGYGAPAAVGAALGLRGRGIVPVTFQADGDLLYAPGVLWTAAHHKIPLLMLMHNNRAYHQEVMHLQRMTAIHNRNPEKARIGTVIEDPDVDFAKVAQGLGVWAEGPITDPAKIQPALQRALAEVKNGRPALIDVVCQGR